MNKMAWTSVPLCVVVSIAFACTVKEDSNSGAGGSNGSSSAGPTSGSTNTSNGTTTGNTTTATSSSTGGGSECAMAMTWEACEECVCTKHQAGCERYWQLEDEHCYCGPNAPCAQQCTMACNGGDWASCDTCADTLDDTCYIAAETACDADPECSAYFEESIQSCDALP